MPLNIQITEYLLPIVFTFKRNYSLFLESLNLLIYYFVWH